MTYKFEFGKPDYDIMRNESQTSTYRGLRDVMEHGSIITWLILGSNGHIKYIDINTNNTNNIMKVIMDDRVRSHMNSLI